MITTFIIAVIGGIVGGLAGTIAAGMIYDNENPEAVDAAVADAIRAERDHEIALLNNMPQTDDVRVQEWWGAARLEAEHRRRGAERRGREKK